MNEKLAKLAYQFANLIDDKEIDKKWFDLANRERWFCFAEEAIPLISAEARKQAVQAVIDWLQGDIDNVDKRSAGLPSLKAIEGVVLQTVINALKEYQPSKRVARNDEQIPVC